MTNIAIETGVQRKITTAWRPKYPWTEMEVGQSIRIVSGRPSSVYNLAKQATHKHFPKKFSGGKGVDGNMHVWRVE